MSLLDNLADRHERLNRRHAAGLIGHRKSKVVIEGNAAFLRSRTGQIVWAVTLNLLARLYKGIDEFQLVIDPEIERISHVLIPNKETNLRKASLRLLADLNPSHYRIAEGYPEIDTGEWVFIRIGGAVRADGRTVAVGANGWRAFINDSRWRELKPDDNPLGAIIAACLGAAAVYKLLYPLKEDTSITSFVFSAYDHRIGLDGPNPAFELIDLPKSYIAGAGAVGMAFLYALGSVTSIRTSGGLHVTDHDPLDDTNLNRCILAILTDIKRLKIDVLKEWLGSSNLGLHIYPDQWQAFVERAEHSDPKNYEWVISCVDRYEGRRAVQYDRLPKVLLTTGTNDFLLSVSRHVLNDGLACGLCHQARAPVMCSKRSDGAAGEFEEEPDPSIGFVSALAGALLCTEYLKAVVPAFAEGAVANAVRVNPLLFKTRRFVKPKDPQCGCSSKYVSIGYEQTWSAHCCPFQDTEQFHDDNP